jgi:hypothetical protein
MSQYPANWYPDPQNPSFERYWDGANWTAQTRGSTSFASAPGLAPSYPSQNPWYRASSAPQNGMGTAGLTLGILGLFLPFLGILAIIFGSIGISRANKGLATNKVAAGWGLGLGIFDVTVSLFFWIAILNF